MRVFGNEQFLHAVVACLLPFKLTFFFGILAFLLFQFLLPFFLLVIRPFLHKISRW